MTNRGYVRTFRLSEDNLRKCLYVICFLARTTGKARHVDIGAKMGCSGSNIVYYTQELRKRGLLVPGNHAYPIPELMTVY